MPAIKREFLTVMYNASDLRKGLKIELDGVPYAVTDFNFVKPGKGQALYICKLKNLVSGGTLNRTFRSNDKMGKPNLEEKNLVYSHAEGEDYVFLDENYEHFSVPGEVLGDHRFFLGEDMQVEALFFNGRPVDVTLPTFVELKVAETEPGFRGNTATNVLKPARLEGGFDLQVPLFINQGDTVKVDTRTNAYADRVSKG